MMPYLGLSKSWALGSRLAEADYCKTSGDVSVTLVGLVRTQQCYGMT